MRLDRAHAQTLLQDIQGRKVAVLGDLMLDEYIFGDVNRISPEAPVPVVRVVRERAVLGGAANVAANLKAIGAEPLLLGVLQEDAGGRGMLALLAEQAIDASGLVFDNSRPTILKTRIIGQHQQMLRLDRETPGSLAGPVQAALATALTHALAQADALIVSDYAKGVVGLPVMDLVRAQCAARGIPWIVDPKPSHRTQYANATLLTPNAKELAELTGLPTHTDDEVAAAARRLQADLHLHGVLVTRSDKGMALLVAEDAQEPWMIPTEAREVYDVSGAGDTVIAVFGAAVASGADWRHAAMLANAAAGIVVGKMGTATTTPEEILLRYTAQEAHEKT